MRSSPPALRSVPSAFWGWLLLSAVLFAAFAACSENGEQQRQRFEVQPAWLSARQEPGHRVHVGEKHLACDSCHNLTAPTKNAGFDHPSPDRCVPCHATQSGIRHALAQASDKYGAGSPSDCMGCHRFIDESASDIDASQRHAQRPYVRSGPDAGAPLSSEAWHCTECHGLGAGTEHALKTHRFADCARCHTPHGANVAEPSACTDCHENINASHGAPLASVQHTCMACHQQMHAPKAAAKATCLPCHSTTSPRVSDQALFSGGHQSCTDCHKAHDFRKQATADCRSCHELPAPLAAAKVPAHAPCGNCHDAHAPKADPSVACQGCHQQLENDHPSVPGFGQCSTCHVAHPAPRHDLAVGGVLPCSDCHEQSVHDGVSHAEGLSCTSCHQPHHFRNQKADSTLCAGCHATQGTLTTTTPGHAQCAACHAADVHASKNPSRSCADCHSKQLFTMHPGHAACDQCHEPHSGSQKTACQSCHREQQQTAPPGHQDCARCHDGHSGARLPSAECESCHQSQARSLHHDIAGGCANCHRAHGPSGPATPPACTSCHQRSSLPALHAVPEHGDCARCHSGHQKHVGFERENCLSCHEPQRQTHFPESPRCSSCHLFQAL